MYGAPVTVRAHEGRPERFVWEGRAYTVHRIFDQWASVRSDHAPVRGGTVPKRWFWRVEAGAEGDRGVYELTHDLPSGQWTLVKV
ncbi:hypothetical protein CLV63_101319 [Murinocardiopsis flavida]|uniref:DUF6504 domain-containing protein n=1 Tax=Murinocardiopsis flavida TaxID=645275 RepID=A0A2P8DUE9_9ACTN|nr:DUF6504 family protein [Murinocardiopsis flavida]PSL00841.1 hypothetical protein CLV63_101319 [Murinocardiopsis flavida]